MAAVIYLALLPIGVIVRGLVLTKLWAWFVVPLGVMPVSVPMALGISTIVALLTFQNTSHLEKRDDQDRAVIESTLQMFLMPLFALFFGWLYTLFM